MSVKDGLAQAKIVNWAANFATPRNIGNYFGYEAMSMAIEYYWRRQRRASELTALVTDHFVRSGASVVDVGASWGLYSYHLARRVGSAGKVYSFEPHPANRLVLQRLAQARLQVRFRPVAISDSAGRAEMLVPLWNNRAVTAQSSLAHGFEGVKGLEVRALTVETARLDDEIDVSQPVGFVKIDVEGYEKHVLQGGRAMFERFLPPLLIEIEQRHLSVPIDEVFRELQEFGYVIYFLDFHALRPISNFNVERDQLSMFNESSFNPFGMPQNYVCNFCAVRSADLLAGLPVES